MLPNSSSKQSSRASRLLPYREISPSIERGPTDVNNGQIKRSDSSWTYCNYNNGSRENSRFSNPFFSVHIAERYPFLLVHS